MLDNVLNIGVLGAGGIARRKTIPAMLQARNCRLVAVMDPVNIDQIAAEFKAKAYTKEADLLADPEVQAVYIASPVCCHARQIKLAAEAGKHILCEKPLALNTAECREMIAACRANGVKLMEAFMYRYTDRIRKVQEILAAGLLGELKYVHAEFRFFLTRDPDVRLVPELGGGCLYDVGCYPVNFVHLVTGEAPAEVAAKAVYDRGVDISFAAVLKYRRGLLATISSGFNSRFRTYAEIGGTEGLLEVPDTFLGDAGSIFLTTAEGRRAIPVAESDRYRLEIEDFAAAVLADRPPRMDLEESLRNMEVIERLLQAART